MFDKIECVTLDLDDTLWPIEPVIQNAEYKLYEWFQKHYPHVVEKYSIQEIEAKRNAMSCARTDIAHNVTQLRFCLLQEIADEFGYSEQFALDGLALFRHYRNKVQLFEDSEPMLAKLKKHYVVGAITNGNAQLEKIEINHYFDFVVSAAEAGVSKPDPKIFLDASVKSETEISKVLHIGDCPKNDVNAAMNAGCKAIWFNKKRQSWPGGQNPHAVIHSLSDLEKILNI